MKMIIEKLKNLRARLDGVSSLTKETLIDLNLKKEKGDLMDEKYMFYSMIIGNVHHCRSHLKNLAISMGEKENSIMGSINSVEDIPDPVDTFALNIHLQDTMIAKFEGGNTVQKIDYLIGEVKSIGKEITLDKIMNEWAMPDDWTEAQELTWLIGCACVMKDLSEIIGSFEALLDLIKENETTNSK